MQTFLSARTALKIAVLLLLLFFAVPNARADAGTQLVLSPFTGSVAIGSTTVVTIDLNSVTDMYGYQFQVSYDASKVSAVGAFVNPFFDTTSNTFIPAGWNASCGSGVCKFAATHLNTAGPVNGSGTLAQITFTGVSAGSMVLTIGSDILSDRDANAISHSNTTANLLVYPVPGSTNLAFNPIASSVAVGNSIVVSIDLTAVTDLYGYQFQVTYDATKVSASGSFVNTFFDTTSGTFIPGGWNGACSAGVCKFAASHLNSAPPVSGTGTLAQITFTGVAAGTSPLAFTQNILTDRDANAMAHTAGIGSIVVTAAPPPGSAQLVFNPTASSVAVGNSVVVSIDLLSVTNLYGYQFQVTYDASKVSATGAFVNSFFDTSTDTYTPGGWNAACSAGVCKFAATHLGASPPLTGSGTLAQITFTGVNGGTVPLAFSGDILADIDGNPISHTGGTATITVYGYATISGTVTLQGRATPLTTGTVTLHDSSNIFPDTVVNFSAATGAFTANVPALAGGSTYNLIARHSLYLRNELNGVNVMIGGTYPQAATQLFGGDANNDEIVDVLDLSCVGSSYDGPGILCGVTGNSDLNADGIVDVFDLVLVGSNYDKTAPQPW